jgi:hypothetical protein
MLETVCGLRLGQRWLVTNQESEQKAKKKLSEMI